MVCQTLKLGLEIMGTSSTYADISKKRISPVINKIQKLTPVKPLTPENNGKENSVMFTRQG